MPESASYIWEELGFRESLGDSVLISLQGVGNQGCTSPFLPFEEQA